jgi:predicted lipid-binding transport protein (Tim44 family)
MMGRFMGPMFEVVAAFVAFALMLTVVAFGCRSSERAVKNQESTKRVRNKASQDPVR